MIRRIAILAFDGYQPLDVVGPFEVFATAAEVQRRRKARDAGYAPVLVSPGGKPLRGESGLALLPELSLSQLAAARGPRFHTLLVAGGRGARMAAQQLEIQRLVRRAAARGERVASVCTGAFVLTASGLLDGKRATTHWAYCKALAASYPEVTVEPDPIYVQDGSVWMTGSSPADYLETVRVETARRLLESSLHSVERVAELSGFGTAESLRRAFARRIGLSPREYRARFGARTAV